MTKVRRRPPVVSGPQPGNPWDGLEYSFPCFALNWAAEEAYTLLLAAKEAPRQGGMFGHESDNWGPAREHTILTLRAFAQEQHADAERLRALGMWEKRLAEGGLAEGAVDALDLAERIEGMTGRLGEHKCALLLGWAYGAVDGRAWGDEQSR